MTTPITKILSSNGICCPKIKTSVERTCRFSRLSPDVPLFSGAKLNAGLISTSGQRWNPLLKPSRNTRRKGMRIRGSDGGVADSGLIAQYADSNKSTSTLDIVQDLPTLATAICTPPTLTERIEVVIERAIFDCRFLTLFGVVGSLLGSMLCFLQGSMFVLHSFKEFIRAYLHNIRSSQVILYLVEAVDVYLMGTVMLIFGMGLYELFVSSLEVPGAKGEKGAASSGKAVRGSNLFGLFTLEERPKWLEIRSLDELKTKLGHVIVMILLVGMFEKSKRVPIHSGIDLLCFAGSILLASSCLYLLAKIHNGKGH